MSVLAVGLSHKSSPVALLERATLAAEARAKFLMDLTEAPDVNESMAVATCNRLEVYADVDKFHGGVAAVCELLSDHTGVPLNELTRHLYVHYEERAVQHLFAVACGLDSMVVGEGQILGQVRAAVKEAQQEGTLGRTLNDLGQRALRVGKRAHTETHLDHAGADMVTLGLNIASRGLHRDTTASSTPEAPARSPGGAAQPGCGAAASTASGADVAAGIPEPQPLTGQRVLVLGAGSMSALAANAAARQGASSVLVANRTFNRAARLAECLTEAYETVQSRAVPFDRAAEELSTVDLVISCTGAQGTVLKSAEVAPAAARRRGRPLVFLDLALPHDIDPQVRELSGVNLIDLEVLGAASAQDSAAAERPGGAVSAVHAIIDEEITEYQSVRRAELVAPTVKALRRKAAAVVDAEMYRLDGRLPDLDDKSRDEVSYALRRVVDKLLHQPTVRIKQLASSPGGGSYDAALRELFDLDPASPEAVAKLADAVDEGEG